MSLLVRWKVSGQLSGWKSLLVGSALYCMSGHWWHHLFLQIVILTECLAWESQFDHCLFEVNSISSFCKVVYVCASHETSPVFWHELDFTACHFIHCILAKRIDRCVRMNHRGFMSMVVRQEKWTLLGLTCSIHVKIIDKRPTWQFFKLC